MANLSNINNKFLVTTGGNVGIGNTSPTLSTLTVGIGSTNSPSQICQLAGSGSGVYSVLSLTNTNGTAADNNGVGLDFHVNAAYSATGRIQLIHPTAQSGTTTNSSMQFLTYGTVSGVTTFSPRMTIDYIGNVGIGTDSPTSIASGYTSVTTNGTNGGGLVMQVNGTATGYVYAESGALVFTNTSGVMQFYNAGSEKMRITSGARINMDVMAGQASEGVIRIGRYDANASRYNEIQNSVTSTGAGSYMNLSVHSGTENVVTDVMTLLGNGNVGIGTATNINAPLTVQASGGANAINIIGRDNGTADESIIDFYQNDGTTRMAYMLADDGNLDFATGGSTVRMRIDSSGVVNIGTATGTQPSYFHSYLNVQNNASTSDNASLTITAGSSGYAGLHFGDSNNGRIGQVAYNNSNNSLLFTANNSTRMTIDSDGNVGIGQSPVSGARLTLGTGAVANEILSFSPASGGNGEIRSTTSTGTFTFTNSNGATELMRITSVGELLKGIQTAAGQGTLAAFNSSEMGNGYINLCRDDTATIKQIRFGKNGSEVGSISTTGSATAFNTSSDYRLKENVVSMTGALKRVSQLKPSRFNFIADADKTVDGFLAHEVQDIVPEAITGEKDGVDEKGNPKYQGIDQSKLVPLLVGAIKELKADNDILKSRIETLENK